MMPLKLVWLSLFLSTWFSVGAGATRPKLLLLCFPVDDLIKRSCQEIEKTLAECKSGPFDVIRLDSPTPATLEGFFRRQDPPLPSHLPVFGVGHGGTDDTGEHYIALRKFWSDEVGPVTSEQFKDPVNTVKSRALNEVLDFHLKSPSKWYMSCHSGGACKPGSNVGASCKSWETTPLAVKNPLKDVLGINLKVARRISPVDPTTRTLVRLLCDREAFESSDGNQDKTLSESELRAQLKGEFAEAATCPTFRLKDKEQVSQLIKIIKSQLAPGAQLGEPELLEAPNTKDTILKVSICQPDCLRVGNKIFSPRLEFFTLFSPTLQKSMEPLTPHAEPKSH